jgi:hypothetical protein
MSEPTAAGTVPSGRRRLVRNARLAGSTALRGLREDPLLFLLQVSRRLPGRVVRGAAARLTRSRWPRLRALAAWLQERPEALADELVASGIRSRVAGELVVQAGRPDLLPAVLPDARGAVRARAAHARGELSEGLGLAPAALARRYQGELAVLRGEFAPSLPDEDGAPPAARGSHAIPSRRCTS